MLSAMLLAMVPWMQISKAAAEHLALEPSALLAAVAAGVGIHLIFLAFNLSAVELLRLGGPGGKGGLPYKISPDLLKHVVICA